MFLLNDIFVDATTTVLSSVRSLFCNPSLSTKEELGGATKRLQPSMTKKKCTETENIKRLQPSTTTKSAQKQKVSPNFPFFPFSPCGVQAGV